MKKFIWITLIFTAFFLCGSFKSASVFAATLEFDPTEKTVGTNEVVELNINVDPDGEQITSIDAYIEYDQNILEFQSIENADYFADFSEDSSTAGKAFYGGWVNIGEYKTEQGTAATISFKALKEGTTTVSFYCDLNENDTSKINKNDFDVTNLIDCNGNKSAEITIGEGGEEPTSTLTPTPTDEDGGAGGEPEETITEAPETSLPQSGIFDNIIKYSAPGIALLLIGLALKLLL
jgi:hypothetical protein